MTAPQAKPDFPAGIYGITAEKFSNGRTNVEVVRQMLAGGIRIIQYREKRPYKSFAEMLAECRAIRALTCAARCATTAACASAAGCSGWTRMFRLARAWAWTEAGAPSTAGASMPSTVIAGPLQIFDPMPPVPMMSRPGSIWASAWNSSSV